MQNQTAGNNIAHHHTRNASLIKAATVALLALLASCGGGGTSTPAPTFNITGAVTGAVLENVTITLTNKDTNASTTANSDASGNYSYKLPNGSYTATPTLMGYTFDPTSIVINLNGADVSGNDYLASGFFPYTKVCNNGELAGGAGACPADPVIGTAPNEWACTLDNNNGLMWEVNQYYWPSTGIYTNWWPGDGQSDAVLYDPNSNPQNSLSLVLLANHGPLCGHNDWRLPGQDELTSIVVLGQTPSIDLNWFPNTVAGLYWTATRGPQILNPNATKGLDFNNDGTVYSVESFTHHHVRLVNGHCPFYDGTQNVYGCGVQYVEPYSFPY